MRSLWIKVNNKRPSLLINISKINPSLPISPVTVEASSSLRSVVGLEKNRKKKSKRKSAFKNTKTSELQQSMLILFFLVYLVIHNCLDLFYLIFSPLKLKTNRNKYSNQNHPINCLYCANLHSLSRM